MGRVFKARPIPHCSAQLFSKCVPGLRILKAAADGTSGVITIGGNIHECNNSKQKCSEAA